MTLENSARVLTWRFACGRLLWLGSSRDASHVAYMIVRFMLAAVVVVVRGDVSKDVDLLVLRHENAVLRRQIKRARYEPADRMWLAALARMIPRRRWAQVFGVTPDTLLRWHRRLAARRWTYPSRARAGRPQTRASITRLVVAMARRILGGDTGGSRANSLGWATRSPIRPCGRS
ncbi:hypothetical protein Psi02_70210 [Planotetraspora silvatica]|uniref:Uncharacterized protein n=1 Tax=Planotetraspora silvatica TaxID=234614 RepID=A0A8J3USN5_9ACTN|nr:hypothetical protein Psi02_70210 [Planotetraspora silvatica]